MVKRRTALVLVGALALASCSSSGSDEMADGAAGEERAASEERGSGKDGADEKGSDDAGEAEVSGAEGLSEDQREFLVEGDTTWDVTYQDDVTVVPSEALEEVTGGADSGFELDRAAAEAVDLEQGRVLLLPGRALGRITSVDERGDSTVVRTEPVGLDELIEDGTVGWDVPVRFDFDQFLTDPGEDDVIAEGASATAAEPDSSQPRLTMISMAMPDGQVVPVQSADEIGKGIADAITVKPEDGAVEWTFESNGNKYQFRLTAKGDSVDILIVVSRGGAADTTMAFRAEGTIGSLRSVSSNSYEGGELAGSQVEVQELATDLDLSVAVAGAGASPVNFEVPVPMLTYTWLVGPVPVTVDLRAEIIGNVDAKANASAQAKASFSYRGSAGFAFEGSDVSVSGATDVDSMDPEPADAASAMGIDVDAQFGVAFPSVSLSIFGQGLVPNIRTGAVIGSNLQWGGPAAGFPASSVCKSAYVRMEVSGGYDFTILGQTLAQEKFVLWQDENRARGESCPPEEG